jgi:tRNA threonylcarbamoyladenosine biosynthesis protein TsaB
VLVAAVDTATLTLSCALVEAGPGEIRLLTDRTDRAPAKPPAGGPSGGHSVRLPGALSELLDALGRKLPEVEGYAVGLGPGSFTGLRIGLATWKGLAYANRRPIAGASSLAAMALEAAASAPAGALLVPLLDARKREVYAGFYRASGDGVEAVAPEAALSPAALLDRLAPLGPAVGFGEGWEAFESALAAGLPRLADGPATPSAATIARLAAPRLVGAAYDAQALFALEPHYVRLSEAETKFPHGLPPPAAPDRLR